MTTKPPMIFVNGFAPPPIIREGGIADPDSYTWECWCEKCQERYKNWKAAFDEEQASYYRKHEASQNNDS